MRRPLFIAEVSSNHHGDLRRCKQFIDRAANAGFDAVKFQLFKVDQLFAPEILARSQEHRRRGAWELPTDFLPSLATHCAARGMAFACTPFHLDAVAVLQQYVAFYKIASYELLWHDLLRACAATGKPVVLSTGMATLEEVVTAAEVLRNAGAQQVTLLHCSSAYPTAPNQANLAAMQTIRKATGCPVGWSDHTRSPGVLHRAVHRWGAEVIELHLDLDGQGAEYAPGHCWLPQEIAPVIRDIREAMCTDGHGGKQPNPAEVADRQWRADPDDGLRPLKALRTDFVGDNNP